MRFRGGRKRPSTLEMQFSARRKRVREGHVPDRKERERIIEVAAHDIRRAIETMAPDDALLSYMFKRLARCFDELWRVKRPDERRRGEG
jgi:hypothetical protein